MLESKEQQTVQEQAEQALKESGATLLMLTEVGSRLYGTDNQNSDKDFCGIFIPSLESILAGDFPEDINVIEPTGEKNTKDSVDFTLWSLHKFMKLLAKGETNAMDLHFSMMNNTELYRHPEFYYRYKKMLTRNIKAFTGYSIRQAQTYGIRGSRYAELENFRVYLAGFTEGTKLEHIFSQLDLTKYKYISLVDLNCKPYLKVLDKHYPGEWKLSKLSGKLQEEQAKYGERAKLSMQGTDWKALSHSVRVLCQCKEYLSSGFITFPLKERDLIKGIKEQHLTLKECQEIIEYKMSEIEILHEKCTLRDSVPQKELNNIISEVIKDFYELNPEYRD